MGRNRLNTTLWRDAVALSSLIIRLSFPLAAQGTSVPVNGQLYGDPIIGTSASGATMTFTQVFVATASGLYGHESSSNEYVLTGDFYYKWYTPPAGRTIVKAGTKHTFYSESTVESNPIVLLDDGTIVLLHSNAHFDGKISTTSTEEWEKVVGDAIYALSTLQVYVSRDTLATWQVDTAGLGATHVWDIALDSAQYVYAATSTGLFVQSPDSNVWHFVSSLPSVYLSSVFVDRKDKIYVSTIFGSLYVSTDRGVSWNTNNTGLPGTGATTFGDDLFGNDYAIAGGEVFRSDSGTAPWTRIDTSIANKILDPVSSYASPYNYIAGDSLLYLGTQYGLFTSTDGGKSWLTTNNGIQAGTLYGFAKTATRQFATTNLGLFYNNLGDTTWTRVFPVNGYAVGNAVYLDNNGNVYTLGPIINFNNSQSPNSNWKSTDNGATWVPDTAGLGVMAGGSITKYYADESGIQHYAVAGIAAECYKKNPGTPWTPDTSGMSLLPANYPNVLASDKHGNIYLAVTTTAAYTGLLMKRPIGGGTWTFDTAGLQGAIVYSISTDQSGNLYAGTYGGGIYKRTGSTWAPISLPGGLLGNNAFVTAVDNSGALFAGFSYQSGFNYAWQGVYYTTNNGGSWTKVGLDGLAVRALIAYGDSIYAVTYTDGMYVLTKTGSTGVKDKPVSAPGSFALYQNYPNPFNPSTKIDYQLPEKSFVTMKVFDILGRQVSTLVNEEESAGEHEATFDASHFASGIYFYRIEFGGKMQIKKMMVLK